MSFLTKILHHLTDHDLAVAASRLVDESRAEVTDNFIGIDKLSYDVAFRKNAPAEYAVMQKLDKMLVRVFASDESPDALGILKKSTHYILDRHKVPHFPAFDNVTKEWVGVIICKQDYGNLKTAIDSHKYVKGMHTNFER